MKPGIELIAVERQRQIDEESWTASHDDQHADGELANAAACYALTNRQREKPILNRTLRYVLWPWDECWWKPKPRNRIRELVKAGALIAAEIDRLQRAKEKEHAR